MIEYRTSILRRTITPYVGQATILLVTTLFLFYVAQKTSQWGLLWSAGLFWVLFAIHTVLFGMKYRILWNTDELVMSASGGRDMHIRLDDISEIRNEIAQAAEFLSQARPLRRIVVYGRKQDPNQRIDISLRHFRLDDIEELLTTVGTRRPDLSVPRVSMARTGR